MSVVSGTQKGRESVIADMSDRQKAFPAKLATPSANHREENRTDEHKDCIISSLISKGRHY